MSDLVAFLKARLDEDEQTARAGDDACWHIDYCDDEGPGYHERFDPARMLREIEADRKLIERYDACVKKYNEYEGTIPCGNDDLSESIWEYEEYVLPLRAARFADHPDYREEWRP
jgi:hypothetical protein